LSKLDGQRLAEEHVVGKLDELLVAGNVPHLPDANAEAVADSATEIAHFVGNTATARKSSHKPARFLTSDFRQQQPSACQRSRRCRDFRDWIGPCNRSRRPAERIPGTRLATEWE
jgi:hypothetical protein